MFSYSGAVSTEIPEQNNKLESTYLYIQMEYCPRTLRQVFESYNHFDKDFAWHLIRQIVEGLAHIHGQGIIHRDFTPNNIFFDARNDVKIGDFGLAKFLKLEQLDQDGGFSTDVAGSGVDSTGQAGTYFYTAPEIEQSWPKIDEKADMYSLGVVFFELWHPFGTAMERHVILTNLKLKGELPLKWVNEFPEQASLLRRLLSPSPSNRPSATELLRHAFPPRMESELLDNILRIMQTSEDSSVYDRVVNVIFDEEVLEMKCHQSSGSRVCADDSYVQYTEMDTELRDYVVEITKEVFRQHCAKHLEVIPMRLLGSSMFSYSGAVSTEIPEQNNKLESTYLYIQMEYCPRTLRQVFESYNHFDKDFAWHLIRQIVEGLAHIHGQGIIHRDFTPNNIFFDARNDVKIGDFGLAKFLKLEQLDQDGGFSTDVAGSGVDSTGQAGTYFYTAPEIEQSWPKIDEKADMYSLGVVFFELWHPFGTAMERHVILTNLKLKGELPLKWANEFPEQASLLRHRPTRKALDELSNLLTYLRVWRIEEHVHIDPLMPPTESYHRNLFFQVFLTKENSTGTSNDGVLLAVGGRYDYLVHQVCDREYKMNLPGAVGVSLALETIFQHLPVDLRPVRNEVNTSVLVCSRGGGGLLVQRMELVAELWEKSIKAEFVPTPDPSLTEQYEYANEHEIKCLVIITEPGVTQNQIEFVKVRHLELKKEKVVQREELVGFLLAAMAVQFRNPSELKLPEAVVNRLQTVASRFCGAADQALPRLRGALRADRPTRKALDELSNLLTYLRVWRIEEHVHIDPLMPPTESYHRNLFFQVFLTKENSTGTSNDGVLLGVGGRYDDLVHQVCDREYKMNLPGAVGVSLALETIFQHLPMDLRPVRNEVNTSVLVCSRGGGGLLVQRMELVAELWEKSIKAEFLPTPDPSLTEQYEYANEHEIKCLVIITEPGVAQNQIEFVKVRHLELKKEKVVQREELVRFLLAAMAVQFRNPSVWS
ncbi:hypothetical protein F2Q70_00041134 [Brassica cretica]|uniref:non-specific serine/threonine protein kinase n=1 Tax=Brassica cretica TaxID=69181 RepID=A0A8S9K6G2_BRACR|nr:hypothetical protein F2Q70_00041134 [Brassica cretica]